MQKLYYSISEISKVIDEEQHILRYWEKEFDFLKPRKNRAGNRIYSDRDFSLIKYIKKLLREDKLSLKEAKENIKLKVENAGGIDMLFEGESSLPGLFDDLHNTPDTDSKTGIVHSVNIEKITLLQKNIKEALEIINKPF